MGPYCDYCDHRCFVTRLVPGETGINILATCQAGRNHDTTAVGFNADTAINPMRPVLCATLGCETPLGYTADGTWVDGLGQPATVVPTPHTHAPNQEPTP